MKLRETEICFNWSIYGKKESGWLLFPLCDSPVHGHTCVRKLGLGKLGPRQSKKGRRENEVGVSGRSHFLSLKKKKKWRYSRWSSASVTMKPSRQKLKDPAPESLIRACHRSNEYHLNCFVYWWSLDVDLICACV